MSVTSQVSLNGRWRILSIDGRVPADRSDGEHAPTLSFDERSVGGTVGCNSFGGLGLLADSHFAIHSLASELQGCPPELGGQEQAVRELFFARPSVRSLGADRVRFEGKSHALEIERIGPNHSPRLPARPEKLTGTSWRIVMVDGQEPSISPTGSILRFKQGFWQGTASCAALSGTWRRQGNRIVVDRIISTEQNCPPDSSRTDDSFVALMRSSPRYLVGPNGELLIAGSSHALTGGRLE